MTQQQETQRKVYLITGASSGIGRAICIEMSQEADIILLARNGERLQETLSAMTPGNHMVLQGDVSQIANIAEYVSQAYAKYGTLDGFAHCAGIGGLARLSQTSYDHIHTIMLTNYYAFMEFVRCLMKPKKKSHPFHIMAISSQAAITHEKYHAAYAASKAALDASIRPLSVELLRTNTTINTIRAAIVATPMVTGMEAVTEDLEKTLKENGFQPMGLIPPEYVAKLAKYLLTDDSRFTTGMVIPINGAAPC